MSDLKKHASYINVKQFDTTALLLTHKLLEGKSEIQEMQSSAVLGCFQERPRKGAPIGYWHDKNTFA